MDTFFKAASPAPEDRKELINGGKHPKQACPGHLKLPGWARVE